MERIQTEMGSSPVRDDNGDGFDLDALLEASVVQAQLADGVNPNVIAARSSFDARSLLALENATKARAAVRQNAGRWTESEIAFLRAYHNILSEQEIADALGRTRDGVHIFSERILGLPRPSRDPRVITTGEIAEMLGVDRGTPANWIDAGVIPGRRLPLDVPIRVVDRVTFLRWAVSPRNWIYFDLSKVQDPYLHRLLKLERERWGDEWWTMGQVERYHGFSQQGAHKQVRRLLGNGVARWGNHRVLRSVAEKLILHRGKGSTPLRAYARGGDAFMVLARAVGLSPDAITKALTRHFGYSREKIQHKQVPDSFTDSWFVAHRISHLRRTGQLDGLLTQYRLRVVQGSHALDVFADWKHYRQRFPSVARAMDKFGMVLNGDAVRMSLAEMWMVRSVFTRWAIHFCGVNGIIKSWHGLNVSALVRAYEALLRRGVDPYKEGYMQITTKTTVSFHLDLSAADAEGIVADSGARFVRELKAAMQEAGVGSGRGGKGSPNTKRRQEEMEDLRGCPYCERTGLNGRQGLNRHIGMSHPSEPKVGKNDEFVPAKANGHLQTVAA